MKPDFASANWATLNDAFEQARRCLGSGELAAGRLHQVLLDGQLKSCELQLPPVDGQYIVSPIDGVHRHILGPEFWRQVQGFTYGNSAARPLPAEGCRVSPYWHFFVLRSDLDRLFPVTARQPQFAHKTTKAVQLPARHQLILKLTDEEFPDGWKDVPFGIRFKKVGDRFKAMKIAVPSDTTFKRAYRGKK
jgi:hypothetical protein